VPTHEEWSDGIAALPQRTEQIWEWTATPRRSGFIVRGGRFRDRPFVADAHADNESWEDAPAVDVGFRCVDDERTDPG